jgi:hypothetical protein
MYYILFAYFLYAKCGEQIHFYLYDLFIMNAYKCQQFLASKTKNKKRQTCFRNPESKRLVKENGRVYKRIQKMCNEQSPRSYTEEDIKQWVKRPLYDPVKHKPIVPSIHRSSVYYNNYAKTYYYYSPFKTDKELLQILPKNHIMFQRKLDVLYYDMNKEYFKEHSDLYQFINNKFITQFRPLKYPKGLHNNLTENEKFVLHSIVELLAECIGIYVYYTLAMLTLHASDSSATLRNTSQRIKYIISDIQLVQEFNDLFATHTIFKELFNAVALKYIKKTAQPELLQQIDIKKFFKLAFHKKNVIKTMLKMCDELLHFYESGSVDPDASYFIVSKAKINGVRNQMNTPMVP